MQIVVLYVWWCSVLLEVGGPVSAALTALLQGYIDKQLKLHAGTFVVCCPLLSPPAVPA